MTCWTSTAAAGAARASARATTNARAAAPLLVVPAKERAKKPRPLQNRAGFADAAPGRAGVSPASRKAPNHAERGRDARAFGAAPESRLRGNDERQGGAALTRAASPSSAAPSGSSSAVTERSGARTAAPAATALAPVTDSAAAGQRSTSSTVDPVASAAPKIRPSVSSRSREYTAEARMPNFARSSFFVGRAAVESGGRSRRPRRPR